MGNDYTVYKITNIKTNKIYIGVTTQKLIYRWRNHVRSYEKDSHTYKLYNSMRKHGIENFTIEKICNCKNKKEMFEMEIYLIKKFNSKEKGYNITDGGENPPNNFGNKRPEHSEFMKKNNPMFNDETRKKHLEIINSDEWKKSNKKTIEKMNTPEANKKISLAMSGDNNPNKRPEVADKKAKRYIVTNPEGEEIEVFNLNRFCRNNNLTNSCMSNVINGNQKQHKGWKCRHAS